MPEQGAHARAPCTLHTPCVLFDPASLYPAPFCLISLLRRECRQRLMQSASVLAGHARPPGSSAQPAHAGRSAAAPDLSWLQHTAQEASRAALEAGEAAGYDALRYGSSSAAAAAAAAAGGHSTIDAGICQEHRANCRGIRKMHIEDAPKGGRTYDSLRGHTRSAPALPFGAATDSAMDAQPMHMRLHTLVLARVPTNHWSCPITSHYQCSRHRALTYSPSERSRAGYGAAAGQPARAALPAADGHGRGGRAGAWAQSLVAGGCMHSGRCMHSGSRLAGATVGWPVHAQ